MSDTLEIRRRRCLWRAAHRGTKELDILVGRFAEARVGSMDEAALARFEAFLRCPEPELQGWLLAPEAPRAGEYGDIIMDIRAFNGLTS
jgi:antitoxin CptB